MNLDHAFAWVAGSICVYVLAVYTITEAAAWNRRRARRAAANRARRNARYDRYIEACDYALWEIELGTDMPVIDIEGGDW